MTPGNGIWQQNGPAISTENEIAKYLRILRKRKWAVIITALVVFVFWSAFVLIFQSRPTYGASVLLALQNPGSMSAVPSKGGRRGDISAFIKTNVLLTQVAEELQLNLGVVTPGLRRSDLFSYVNVDSKSRYGEYKLKFKKGHFTLYYSNPERKIKDYQLLTFAPGDTVNIYNLTFVVNTDYLLNSPFKDKDIVFRVNKMINTLAYLKRTVNASTDKYRTTLTISAYAKSPYVAAKIANTVADKFIQLSLKMKRYNSDKVLEILEEQLKLAKQEMDEANEKLKAFKEKYPWVGLTAGVQELAMMEGNKSQLASKIEQLNTLIAQVKRAATTGDKIIPLRELLTYLSVEGLPLVPAFMTEFSTLTSQRASLLNSYAPTHPFVKRSELQVDSLANKITATAVEYLGKLEARQQALEGTIQSEKYKMTRLPAKQLELAMLVRESRIKSDLYERILQRYNVAKIDNQTSVSGIMIVDRATPPPLQSTVKVLIKKLGIGFFLAIGIGVGFAIVLNFFDKTVTDAETLREKLKIPVIGNIPVIKNDEDEIPKNLAEIKGKRDSKLITLDYSPTLESESYRELRTKILFMNQNKDLSSFLVTSLRPGEGKSLTAANIAITIAQQKISTLLIDGDLRRGVLHNVFGNNKKPGLSDFLVSKATVDLDNINKLVQKTLVPNLYLISAGSPIPNPTEMLGSERLVNTLKLLKSRFGMIIMDTAPFLATSDSVILSNFVDGVLVLVRAGFTNVELLSKKLEEYPDLQKKTIGLVLNMVKMNLKKSEYGYQYSYYNY